MKPMEIISILETHRYIVQFLKIFIPTPRKVNGISKGEGVSKAQFFKGRYDAKMEFKLKYLPWGGYGFFLEQQVSDFSA